MAIKSIKLINPKAGNEFDVNFSVPSGRVRDKLLALRMEQIKEYNVFDAETEEVKKSLSGSDILEFGISRANEVVVMENNYAIRYLKAVIDDRQNPTEEKELLATEATSEFWQEQDLEAINKAADEFFLSYGARRR